jgi:hypothetical protein
MGIETDTQKFKVGDGTTAWNSLGYGGIMGPTGNTGATGAASTVTGPTGTTGATGAASTVTGPTGSMGIDGFSGGLTLQMSYTTQIPSSDGTVSTLAGSSSGSADGTGTNAQFLSAVAITMDISGNLYVGESLRVRKITPSKVVTTLAGSSEAGYVDGTGINARFNDIRGITVDSSGNVYVTDRNNTRIRKISPLGVVTTFAGNSQYAGTNGTGTNASFGNMFGLTIDTSGNLYAADAFGIRKITPAGVVSSFAGGGPDPFGIAIDTSNNIYVANRYNLAIYKYNPAGQQIATIVENAYSSFNTLWAIAVDPSGNVYVSDSNNNRIRKISTSGVITTVAGLTGNSGNADGVGTNARFSFPYGIITDSIGNIYVADDGNKRIRKIAFVADPNTFSDGPITGTLLTTFNPALTGSTITIPAGTTNAKVASFTVAASSLPLKTSVTGVWTLTLYATVGLSTSPASFYFEVVDGSTTVATGTTTTSVNLSSPMQLYKSNLTIPARTYTTDLTLNIYATTQASSSLIIGFNGSTISYVNTTIPSVGNTGPTGSAGSAGSTGPTGSAGSTGTTGNTGPTGSAGNTGAAGSVSIGGSTGFGNVLTVATGGTGGFGNASLTFNGSQLDVSGGLTVRNGFRPLYMNVSGTSLTVPTNAFGTHYNITNSAFASLTLPTINWSNDSNGYWVFRNNTSSYLSTTVTYSSAGTSAPTNPVVIPPANSTTIMVTYPSGTTSNYVLF